MIGIFTLVLEANESREVAVTGEYFELRNAPSALALVELMDRTGGIIAKLDAPEQSDYVRPGLFETVRITNGATAQTIKYFYGTGDAGSRRFSGNVTGTVSIANGATTQAAFNVTNASTNMLAAKDNRRYLMVQNNDATGVIFINLAGGIAAAATGIKIIGGAAIEIQGFVPNGVITAIGSIASNPNVTVVEG